MQTAEPITRVAPTSVAKVAAFYYGFWGTVSALLFTFTDSEKLLAPFGIWTVFLKFTVNLKFDLHYRIIAIIAEMIIVACAYSLTGWITGLISAVGYNFLSKHFGINVQGTIEPKSSE